MPPCLTPFETMKTLIVDWAHFYAHFLYAIPKDKQSNNQQRTRAINKLISKPQARPKDLKI